MLHFSYYFWHLKKQPRRDSNYVYYLTNAEDFVAVQTRILVLYLLKLLNLYQYGDHLALQI
jgi:hypothetical protein